MVTRSRLVYAGTGVSPSEDHLVDTDIDDEVKTRPEKGKIAHQDQRTALCRYPCSITYRG